MGRPRAGHGLTFRDRGGKNVAFIFDGERWVTTYEAHKWPRCARCRRPEKFMPFDHGLCCTCFFYHNDLPSEEFWALHDQGYPLAPYNIGRRATSSVLP